MNELYAKGGIVPQHIKRYYFDSDISFIPLQRGQDILLKMHQEIEDINKNKTVIIVVK